MVAGAAGQRDTFKELVCQIARRPPPVGYAGNDCGRGKQGGKLGFDGLIGVSELRDLGSGCHFSRLWPLFMPGAGSSGPAVLAVGRRWAVGPFFSC